MIKMTRPQEIDMQEVLRLRRLGYTLSQIANQLNFTRQGISKALRKTEKRGELGVRI